MIEDMMDEWKGMTDDEKKKYVELANEDKKRYAREMKEYLNEMKKANSGKKSWK
jgi:hypothetical protein